MHPGGPFSEVPHSAVLPKNFLRPCILLLLRERPSHGYDLVERLIPLGFAPDDHGRLYRALRALESEGLVRSGWVPSAVGPARRIYELTPAGASELRESVAALAETHEILDAFLCRCDEERSAPPAP